MSERMIATYYAVFNDTDSRNRALAAVLVGKEDGRFDVEAFEAREIKFLDGDKGVFEFCDVCEEDFVIEERKEN
jgi:hypothetical protein